MKKFVLLSLGILLSIVSFAQDVIIKRNGEEINAKVEEITTEVIKYKRQDYLDGPTISILKREVFMIKYANGTKETFATTATPSSPNPTATGTFDETLGLHQTVKLSGPRIGFTVLSGPLAKEAKEKHEVSSFLTQFGWQFETRMFTTASGLSGLLEFVPLIGGLEQGKFIPSLNALVGLRGPKGFEVGLGPNLTPVSAGVVFAVGTNFQSEGINFPMNLAVVPSSNGVRFSLLLGFNSRKF